MALTSAVVIGLMNRNANSRRAPNCRRESCSTTESDLTSSRLTANDIQRLAVDYRNWRLATHRVHMKLNYSEKCIRVFLLYLAKGGYYRQLGQSEGLAKCTTMIYLQDVAAFFHNIAARQE